MAHPYTFPTLFDEVLTISTTSLKQWGYLNPGQFKSGVITWSQNSNKTGSISIAVDTRKEPAYIELDYKFQDEPRKYKIELTTLPSNLGLGNIYYFVCPHTGKHARKLYSIGGYFLHREAFRGCMYECQTQSKKYREFDKTFGTYYKTDELYEEIHSKYFKTHYAGKPTKRFLQLMKLIQQSEQINRNELIELFKS